MDKTGQVTVDQTTGKLSFNENELPKLAQFLKPTNAMEQQANEAALRLSGLAITYFEGNSRPDGALETAKTKLQFKQVAEIALETPEVAMKAAEYLQAMQYGDINGRKTLWKDDPKGFYWTNLPKMAFELDNQGQVKEICFGDLSGPKVGNSVLCGERKEK